MKIIGTKKPDLLIGTEESDAIRGKAGGDVLSGHGGNDAIRGQKGSDRIIGGDGDDILYGGKGDDTISGGTGKDMIFGGSGHDIFILDALSSFDVIADFNPAEDIVVVSPTGDMLGPLSPIPAYDYAYSDGVFSYKGSPIGYVDGLTYDHAFVIT